jgi:hypothetical protein
MRNGLVRSESSSFSIGRFFLFIFFIAAIIFYLVGLPSIGSSSGALRPPPAPWFPQPISEQPSNQASKPNSIPSSGNPFVKNHAVDNLKHLKALTDYITELSKECIEIERNVSSLPKHTGQSKMLPRPYFYYSCPPPLCGGFGDRVRGTYRQNLNIL